MSTSQTKIRSLTSDIKIFTVPFARFGIIPFGGRSTAVRLRDGSVFVAASHPLTPETKTAINEMGPVKYIVALDAEHTGYTKDFAAEWPAARLIGPYPVLESKKELNWAGVFGRDEQPLGPELTQSGEIKAQYFDGHANKDIAFLHTDSKTLIQADLLFNLPAIESYGSAAKGSGTWPFSYLIKGMNPYGKTHQYLISMVSKDKANMAAGAKVVSGWDFNRIIPCHGEVIEGDGKQAWNTVFKQFL